MEIVLFSLERRQGIPEPEGIVHPFSRQQLLSPPIALVEVQQPDPQHIFHRQFRSVPSGADSFRALHPGEVPDAYFPSYPFLEQFLGRLALHLLDDIRKDIGIPTGIHEGLPRLLVERHLEICLFPACVQGPPFIAPDGPFLAVPHGQKVPEGAFLKVPVGTLGLSRKVFQQRIIQLQQPICKSQAHRRIGQCLGKRMHDVGCLTIVRCTVRFKDHPVMDSNHDAMDLQSRFFTSIQKVDDMLRIHLLLPGPDPFQRFFHGNTSFQDWFYLIPLKRIYL